MLTTRCRPHVPSVTAPVVLRGDRLARSLALALALAVGSLAGCDVDSEAGCVEVEVDLETARMGAAQGSGDGPSGDGPSGDGPSGDGPSGDGPSGDGPSGDGPAAADTDDGELTAGGGSPALAELSGEGPELCAALPATPVLEADIDWDHSAGSTVSVRIGLERPDDAELSLDVAVVVDGETMVELPSAAHLGREMVARSAVAAERDVRPFEVTMALDTGELGVDLGALGAGHGMLVLVAKVRRGDGEVEAARRPLFLFFAVDGAGVELVDEATGSARGLGRGALSLEPALPDPGGEPADQSVGEGAFKADATGRRPIDREGVRYVSAKLCARHSVTYTDARIAAEDGTATTAARRMIGADARVYAAGQKIWSGKLGDGTGDDAHGEGCTPFLWMPAGSVASMFYDTDTGSIGGNLLEVRVEGGSAPATFLGFSAISQSGTYTRTGVNTSSVYPTYLAMAKVMQADSGGARLTHAASTEHRDGSADDRVVSAAGEAGPVLTPARAPCTLRR